MVQPSNVPYTTSFAATNRSRDFVPGPGIIAPNLSEGCSQVVTKRATKNYVVGGRVALRAATVALGLVLIAGCANNDYTGSATPIASSTNKTSHDKVASVPVVVSGSSVTTVGAPVTGADGYPNINVDTARRPTGPARSAADQDKLEAELMALGARNRSGGEGTSASAIQELQELGRRSKAEAEQQIESGTLPAAP